jgi:spermidine/putrescine-binding protein
MIVTPKYALVVPTGQPNPSVIKIDLSTLTSELVVYKPVDNWKSTTPSYMHQMENGNILFGMGYNLFIVDNENILNIKQIIPKGNPENH